MDVSSGTTYRECFEQAVAAAMAGETVLTGNVRSARAIRAAAEQRLCLTHTAWPTPDVLPYGAWVERLYAAAMVSGAASRTSLRREQELHLWRQIIDRSSSGRRMLLTDPAAALASESYRTAMEYGIALNSPAMQASSDTRAFAAWANEFERQLQAHGWTCQARLTRELSGCLREIELPAKLHVFLASLTPEPRKFFAALGEAGLALSFAAPYANDETLSAARHEFDGEADELRATARWAREQVQRSPGSRTGIIFFDLERRAAQVESVFRAVLQPEELLGAEGAPPFEIAAPRPLAGYPVVHCALGLLRLFAEPVEFHAFAATLSSPYISARSGNGRPERVARFLKRARKHSRLQVTSDDLRVWLNSFGELPELREAVHALPSQSVLAAVQSATYWTQMAKKIFDAFGWPGEVKLTSEEFQATQRWRDLLNAVASLEMLDWKTDFAGYVRRLEQAAASQRFKPETLGAPVQIMDAEEAEGSLFDALWIGQASDEQWPDAVKPSPLLPLPLLKAAGAPVTGTPEADERVRRITRRLLHSAPGVVLSLARRTEDEREQRWSPAFAHLPLEEFAAAPWPLCAELFSPAVLESQTDAQAPALEADERAHGGSSLLQDQSLCPFRAFAVRRLLAAELEGPNEALPSTDRGKVVELALQYIWERLKDSEGLKAADREVEITQAVERAMREILPAAGDRWTLRFRELERRRTVELLREWLAMEAARAPFRVLAHQRKVAMTLGGIEVHGRIDRMDEVNGAQVVLDYKTGKSTAMSAWRVPRPTLPQLPFYAVAVQQQEVNVAGVAFAVVRKGEAAFKGYLCEDGLLPCKSPSRRNFEGRSFDEYAGMWAAELERIAASFVKGDAAVDPKIPPGRGSSTCEHCHLTALCRVGELGVEEDAAGEEDGDE